MAYRRNSDNWGYIHPECAPEPGRYSHVPVPAFFGHHVQLIFVGERGVDRMWVMVIGPAETENQELQGIIDNEPLKALEWSYGTVIEFLREEIVKVDIIYLPPTPYQDNPTYRRNADDTYREAERRAAASGSDIDQAAFLREKVRVDELSGELLPLLGYLTYRPAQIAMGDFNHIPKSLNIPSLEDLRNAAFRLEAEIRQAYGNAPPENPPPSLEAIGGGGVDNAADISVQQFYQSQYNSIRKIVEKVFTHMIRLCPQLLLRVRALDLRYRIAAAAVNLHKNYLRDNTDEVGDYARSTETADMALMESSAERQGLDTEYPLYQDIFIDHFEILVGIEAHGLRERLEAAPGWDDYNLFQALYQQMSGLYAYLGPTTGEAFSPERSPHALFLSSLAYSILELGWQPVRAAIIKELIPWLLDEEDPLVRTV